MSLVWSEHGYPAHSSYRDYHHHTVHHHQPWANDGSAYDHAAALALAREHAADFVARTLARLREDGAGLPGGGLVVCALDTELLGHWWYEGAAWLAAVVDECARQGLELVRLDDALERCEPAATSEIGGLPDEKVTTWGAGGDLSTWSSPKVADIAFAIRAAELRVQAAGPRAGAAAVRELLALQSSDWAFMVSETSPCPTRASASLGTCWHLMARWARDPRRAPPRYATSPRGLIPPRCSPLELLFSRLAHAVGMTFALLTARGSQPAASPIAIVGHTRLPRPPLWGPSPYSQRKVCGVSRIRITRAGTPPTTAFAGTSLVTTAFVPTIALSPTLAPRSTQAP